MPTALARDAETEAYEPLRSAPARVAPPSSSGRRFDQSPAGASQALPRAGIAGIPSRHTSNRDACNAHNPRRAARRHHARQSLGMPSRASALVQAVSHPQNHRLLFSVKTPELLVVQLGFVALLLELVVFVALLNHREFERVSVRGHALQIGLRCLERGP